MDRLGRGALVPLAVMLAAGGLRASDSSAGAPERTADSQLDLSGVWIGNVGSGPGLEDWTHALVTLEQSGTKVVGTIADQAGGRWRVDGETTNEGALLNVVDVPGTSTCSLLQLSITSVERGAGGQAAALLGAVLGRCYGTVYHEFRLERRVFRVRRRV